MIGIKKNDNLLIHSSLFQLGIIENGVKGFDRAVKETIGQDANIVVPTFTYSFRRKEIFDVKKSKSDYTIGVYSEFLRKNSKSIRSLDGLFSMSCIGPASKDLMEMRSKHSFGKKSIFQRLFDQKFKILSINVPYTFGISAFMHVEKIAKVFYRYDRKFEGNLIDYQKKKRKTFQYHFARKEKIFRKNQSNREIVGKLLEKKNISKAIKYKNSKIFSINCKQFEDYTLELIYKNPKIMLKKII